MTSRTTKQAARAYQKAHGVPYAEALRVVMGGHHPGERDFDFDFEPHEKMTGPGVKTVDLRVSGTTQLDPFGIAEGPDGEAVYVDRGEGAFVTGTRSGKTTLRPPPQFKLGALPMPTHSGLVAPDAGVPLIWDTSEPLRDHGAAILGVYGEPGVGKSVYLATLVRDNLVGVPTLVVTPYPKNYPEQEGLSFLTGEGDASTLPPAQAVEAATRGGQVLVCDMPYELDELDELTALARKHHALLLFANSYDDRPVGEYDVAVTIPRTPGRERWTTEPAPAPPTTPIAASVSSHRQGDVHAVTLARSRNAFLHPWETNAHWVQKRGAEPVRIAYAAEPFLPRR